MHVLRTPIKLITRDAAQLRNVCSIVMNTPTFSRGRVASSIYLLFMYSCNAIWHCGRRQCSTLLGIPPVQYVVIIHLPRWLFAPLRIGNHHPRSHYTSSPVSLQSATRCAPAQPTARTSLQPGSSRSAGYGLARVVLHCITRSQLSPFYTFEGGKTRRTGLRRLLTTELTSLVG